MNSLRGMPASRTAMIMISFSSWRIWLTWLRRLPISASNMRGASLSSMNSSDRLLADLERLRILGAHLLDVRRASSRDICRPRRSGARPLPDPGRCRRLPLPRRCRRLLRLFTLGLLFGHGRREIHLGGVLRLRDDVGRVRIDEADDDVDQAGAAGLHRLVGLQQVFGRRRVVRQREAHGVEAFLDALGDADFAFAREQLDRAHLAHVHAHRVGGAAELGVERGQRGGGFFDGFFVGGRGRFGRENALVVRRLFVHRNAHVVNRVDDLFDLFRDRRFPTAGDRSPAST